MGQRCQNRDLGWDLDLISCLTSTFLAISDDRLCLSNQKLHIFLLYINYLVLVIIYRDKNGLRKAECPFIISVEHIWLKYLYLREKNICSNALFSSFFFFVRLFLDRHAAFARDLERKRTCDNSLFSFHHGLFFFHLFQLSSTNKAQLKYYFFSYMTPL